MTSAQTRAHNVAFAGVLLLAVVVVRPFANPLGLAAILSASCHPLYRRLRQALAGRAHLAAGMLSVGLLLFVLLPLGVVTATASQELAQGLAWLRDTLGVESLRELPVAQVSHRLQPVLQGLQQRLPLRGEDLDHALRRGLELLQHVVPSAVGASFGAVGMAALVMVAFYFLTLEAERLMTLCRRLSPLPAWQTHMLLQAIDQVATSALLGALASAAVCATVVGVGFYISGLGHALFFATLALFAAFIPVAGSALVWLPGALTLAARGEVGWATALAGMGLAGSLLAGNVIKPWVVGGRSNLHGGLMFFSILGGIAALGPMGLFAGPVVVAMLQAFVRMRLDGPPAA